MSDTERLQSINDLAAARLRNGPLDPNVEHDLTEIVKLSEPSPVNPMATEGNLTLTLSEYHVVNLRELLKCCGFDGTGQRPALFHYNTGDWIGELYWKLEKLGPMKMAPNVTYEQVQARQEHG